MSEVQWVRLLNRKIAFKATEQRLKSAEFFPCDVNGNFLQGNPSESRGSIVPDEPVVTGNGQESSENAPDSLLLAMRERAKELGIKNAHTMKEETLTLKIAEAEEAAAAGQ